MKIKILITIFLSEILFAQSLNISTLEWPPFSGKELPNNGLALERISRILKTYNVEAKFYFFPWARALRNSSEGTTQALAPEYYSKEREIDFYFSDPFMTSPLVLVANRNFPINSFEKIKELSQYKIGTVRGYINTPEIDHDLSFHKEETSDDLSNIKRLAAGRIQLIIIDLNVFNYLIEHYKIKNNFKIITPYLEEKNLYIVFPKKLNNSKEERDKFNLGLKKLNSMI